MAVILVAIAFALKQATAVSAITCIYVVGCNVGTHAVILSKQNHAVGCVSERNCPTGITTSTGNLHDLTNNLYVKKLLQPLLTPTLALAPRHLRVEPTEKASALQSSTDYEPAKSGQTKP